ncbi:hypothetical protein D3C81_1971830 [compost metagenome]
MENEISGANDPGELLIVKKGPSNGSGEMLVYDKVSKKLFITSEVILESDGVCVVGEIVEERF